jgi:hypothetical protein
MNYTITTKGRAVLRSATLMGLSRHLRELLALCDPQVRLEHARQFIPPHSLQIALYSLQQLELIDGPPTQPPKRGSTDWALDTGSRWLRRAAVDTQPA